MRKYVWWLSRGEKVVLHPTEQRWRKTEGSQNNGLRIRPCAKNVGKGLFALISWLGVVALLLSVSARPVLAQEVVDRIVAVVNGELITLFELNQRFKPILDQFDGQDVQAEDAAQLLQAKRKLLDQMVDDILLRQEAERMELTVSDVEVQNHLRQVREQAGVTNAQFQEQLKSQGLDPEMYEQRIRDEILQHRLLSFMIRRKVVITEQEIQDYYRDHPGEFSQQRQVHLALILFASRSQAEQVVQELRDGTISFDQAARQYSRGPGAAQGGDIGVLAWNDLAGAWRSALEGLEVGRMSPLFSVQDQPALLKLLDEKAGEVKPLPEVQDQIREKLMQPRLEARYDEYLDRLRDQSVIDIRLQ
jgi:peptidyl-prolyl cis-trans isomerase SurA